MRTALAETERRMSKVTRVPDTRLFLTSGPRGCRQLASLLRRSAWMASVLIRFYVE